MTAFEVWMDGITTSIASLFVVVILFLIAIVGVIWLFKNKLWK